MAHIEMLGKFLQHRKLLYDQGFLDDQFTRLQQIQDESNPNFVLEVVELFFNVFGRILNDLYLAINEENVDFKKINDYVHQLKGSSASVGAHRLKNGCIAFGGFCYIHDAQPCQACRQAYLQQVKQEYFIIKENLHKLLTMERQIVAAGGFIPPMDSLP